MEHRQLNEKLGWRRFCLGAICPASLLHFFELLFVISVAASTLTSIMEKHRKGTPSSGIPTYSFDAVSEMLVTDLLKI